MAKSKTSAQQPSLLKQHIPQMPEGYYSSGPNPNLRRFVEEHATPYDPATDEYDVPAFDRPITTTKATPIYNMHGYEGKKPHDATREYVRHHTQPGDLVLDPFCGSGGTALAAMAEGRAAIAIDLSPAATLITKHYCTPVNLEELQRAFDALLAEVAPEFDWLYATRCDRCDGLALTDQMVYSHVYQCPRCLARIPLFDCVEVQSQTAAGKPKTIRVCPLCLNLGHTEEISTRGERFDAVPVLANYVCVEGCRPKRGERRHDDPDAKKRAYFEQYDLGKLCEIEAKQVPHWTPRIPMIKGYETTVKRNLARQGIALVDDLFTKRNRWAIAALFDAIDRLAPPALRHVFQLSVTGFLGALSRMQRYYPESSFPNMTLPGTYYLPPVFAEENVRTYFANKMARNITGLTEVNRLVRSPTCLISTQSATDLGDIPPATVDYVYTDPPYSSKVQYGELNFVMETWLRLDTTWHEQEIIVNEVRGKTEADWADAMRQAMSECYRVLKPGRWLSLCYHDTSEGTWHLVQDLMTEVGFLPEQLEEALYIDTEQKSFNQYTADKATKRDLVINFRKPRPGELSGVVLSGDEDAATFTEKAHAILTEALEKHPGSPVDRLYDELVSRMVRRGQFERHNFDVLLRGVAEDPRADNHWYLAETADQTDAAESARETAAAARLQTFMAGYLVERPEESGVHYSDLFEHYLPVKDKPRRLLADWLPEFFFKTLEGTWRPPANAEERVQKEALRTSGTLRRIKRFARALLEAVPPADRDRPPNIATAADWLRQCRRSGLYELGRALYEKGGFRFDELGEAGRLEVDEDYQTCVRRSG